MFDKVTGEIIKTCTKCGEDKPLSKYYRSNFGGKYGYTSDCKVCCYVRLKAWRASKRLKLKETAA